MYQISNSALQADIHVVVQYVRTKPGSCTHLITPVFSSDTCLASSLCLFQQQIVRNLIICGSSLLGVIE